MQTSLSIIKVPRNSCLEYLTLNEEVIVSVINTPAEALSCDEFISSDIPNGSRLHRDMMDQSSALECRIILLLVICCHLYSSYYLSDILTSLLENKKPQNKLIIELLAWKCSH